MTITHATSANDDLIRLISLFRKDLNKLNKVEDLGGIKEAIEEAKSYFSNNRDVFTIYDNDGQMNGFSVLKWEDGIAWLDWMFIEENKRRKGIASVLFDYTEKYAIQHGSDQLYIWVHPDNDKMLKLMSKKGYNVLSLIELKKQKTIISTEIPILNNKYKY